MATDSDQIGPYRLLETIGKGATAQVYRAIDERSGRVVALKRITDLDRDAELRYLAEVRSLRRLSHPGVVEILDHGEGPEGRWLAMELVEGVALDVWVNKVAGPTRLRRILLAAERIAEALAVLHDAGILHRDIKPANVLVSARGRVVLVDFGFAAHLDRVREHGSAGTMRYMAPERLTGGVADPRSDLFSLGVVLFELLARRAPHLGSDTQRLILAQCTQPAPSVREFAPEAPTEIIEMIDRLLAKPVADRPRDAREVAQAFRQGLARNPRPQPWRPTLRTTAFVGHTSLLASLVGQGTRPEARTIVLLGPHGVGLSRILQEVQGRLLVRGGLAVLLRGGRRLLVELLDALCGPLQPSDLRAARLGADRDLLLAAWPELARPTEDLVALSRVPTPQDLMAAVRRVLGRVAAEQRSTFLIDDADRCDPRDLSLVAGHGLLLLASHEDPGPAVAGQRILVPPLDARRLATLAELMLGKNLGRALIADHGPQLGGLPGRVLEQARRLGPEAATPPAAAPVRLRPWANALDEAEALLARQGPSAARQVLTETPLGPPSEGLQQRLILLQFKMRLQAGEARQAEALAQEALRRAQVASETFEAELALATAWLHTGALAPLFDLAQARAAQAREAGEREVEARWTVLLARARLRQGRLREARALLEELGEAWPLSQREGQGLTWTLAEVCVRQADWARAQELLRLSTSGGLRELSRRGRGGLRSTVGELWLRRGEARRAGEQLERAWHELAPTEDRRLLAELLPRFAESRLMLGHVEESGRLVRESLDVAHRLDDPELLQDAYRVALRQARLAGEASRVVGLLERACELEPSEAADPGRGLLAQIALATQASGDLRGTSRAALTRPADPAGEDPYSRAQLDLARLSLDPGLREPTLALQARARALTGAVEAAGFAHLATLGAALLGTLDQRPANSLIESAVGRGDMLGATCLELATGPAEDRARIAAARGFPGLLGPSLLAP